MLGELSLRNLSWGMKMSLKGAQNLLALLKKKNNKKYMKKFFSAGSKEQH